MYTGLLDCNVSVYRRYNALCVADEGNCHSITCLLHGVTSPVVVTNCMSLYVCLHVYYSHVDA